jgi:uncharacterized protein
MFTYKNSTALVTGASAGLGEAFAEELAARGSNVVLVARSGEKLVKLAFRLERDYRIKATVIAADLAAARAADEVASELRRRAIQIDLLVNNAGFGVFERFLDYPLEKQMAQLDINVRALVSLSHAFAPAMVSRDKGGIINLASSAAFQPLAGASLYAASKAFVLSFSEALAQELSKTGVRVLAVCPGPVATQFYADMNPAIARNEMDQPRDIVRQVLKALDHGKRVLVPGKLSVRMTAFGVRFLPSAYSAHCDRRFRSNVTGHSDGSALGGFLTPIGHVASTFSPFPGFSIFVHGVTRRAACRDSGRSSWRSMSGFRG